MSDFLQVIFFSLVGGVLSLVGGVLLIARQKWAENLT